MDTKACQDISQDLKSLELEYTILKRNGASNLFLFGQFLCQYGCLLILSCCIGVSLSTYLTKTYHDSIQNIITFPIQHHQLQLLDYSILLSGGIAIIATSIICWLGFLHIKQSTLRV